MGIQAHELKINNWVHLKDKGYYQIDSGHDIDEISTHEGTDYCTHIPLTEDILLKSGFEKTITKRTIDIIDFRKGNFVIYIIGNGSIEVEYGGLGVDERAHLVTIKHIHQLQNLYFALTGTELIVNL